ncbi:hypothetical protein DM860_016876 [Cuscuta australis]|uniref:Protein kinase domain-containing protein n=1 Tax=Cuscuta australis TaxID=267555 RepID=A0A328E1A2_9ASTE|nr:hypothetical protein DM860_016876 [Cuscuta australis]
MGCFYCIRLRTSCKDVKDYGEGMVRQSANSSANVKVKAHDDDNDAVGKKRGALRGKNGETNGHKDNVARSFTFKELATATQNFRVSNLLGEGGFGSVYKGRLDGDMARPIRVVCLDSACRPFLRDRSKFVEMVDPLLEGQYSVRCLHHAVAITAMCLQEQANFRPLISDIAVALEYLVSQAESSDSHRPGRRGKSDDPPKPDSDLDPTLRGSGNLSLPS